MSSMTERASVEEAILDEAVVSTRRDAPRKSSPRPRRHRTIDAALEADPDLSLALISLPGAAGVHSAHTAIDRGLHVFLFSNDISIEDEVALKRAAMSKGLLVMGPYCGTSILDGVPLGFVNSVPRGPVGIVGASGTGIQEATSLLAARGIGVSHAIGAGSRDLSSDVGGLSALHAIDILGKDPSTEIILIISKPPAKSVAQRVLAAARATGKAVVACFLGTNIDAPPPSRPSMRMTDGPLSERGFSRSIPPPPPSSPTIASDEERDVWGTLEASVLAVAAALGRDSARKDTVVAEPVARAPWQRRLIGYFSGGSLAHEAVVVIGSRFEVSTNLFVEEALPADSGGHTVLDLGCDEFTNERAHPMIDPTVRNQLIEQIADDPTALVLLVDVVLGHGAHPDPAGALVPSLQIARAGVEARGGTLHIVASVTGTDDDPQVRSLQVAKLERAGVIVAPSNAAAARAAASILRAGQLS